MTKKVLLALSLALSAMNGFAQTELDAQVTAAPKEIIVREDAQGNREVFKVSANANVKDDVAAHTAIEKFVTAENSVQNVVARGELDQTTSQEAWYYWYNPYFSYGYSYNYSYSYSYYGYNYNYRPYYYYNYGYYNYYYYRY